MERDGEVGESGTEDRKQRVRRRSESESVTAEEKISFSGRRVSSRHALSHQEDEDGGGTNGATPLENIARR